MTVKNLIDKLNKIAIVDNTWQKTAQERIDNEAWLKLSAQIAIRVLRSLRAKGWSQKKLAEILGVSDQFISKIVKGNVNLTLETISKLESALMIKLIDIPRYSVETELENYICSAVNEIRKSVVTERITQEYDAEADFTCTAGKIAHDDNYNEAA